MSRFQKIIVLSFVACLLSACTFNDRRTRQTEESLIYSMLINLGCHYKATELSIPPTYIFDETYFQPPFDSFDDEYVLRQVPTLMQETLDAFRAVGQERQILDSSWISNNESCEFISQARLDVLDQEDPGWYNEHLLLSFSSIGFNESFDQAIVYREYYCGGECAGGDLYILMRGEKAWYIERVLDGWRS